VPGLYTDQFELVFKGSLQDLAAGLHQIIRGHWEACENRAHYRRDVTLGEDASLIASRTEAFVMATLRNVVLGLFELHKYRAKTTEKYLPGWLRKMTASQALKPWVFVGFCY